MSVVAIAPDVITRAGKTPTSHSGLSTGNVYCIPNEGRTILRVKNGNAAVLTVTIVTPGLVDGQAVADRVVELAKNEEKDIGPFPPDEYNNEEGKIEVKVSAVTEVSFEAKVLSRS